MRTIPAPLLAALTASPRKAAECVVVEARDGTRVGFTTWSSALTVDLGLGDGPELCDRGMTLSAVTLAAGFDSSSFELSGPVGGDFSRVKVRGGKWRQARAWLVRVSPGVAGVVPILRGRVAECRVEGRRFVFEVRNAADAFNQSWGDVMSPLCRATFGQSATGCPVVRTAYPCAVTAVTDDFRFTVDLAGQPDDFFNTGTVHFLTGELAGTDETTVFDFAGTGAVELVEPLAEAPQVGDTLNLYRGCSRLIVSDDASLPTCSTWGATVDFRGEPEVPSSRVYHRVSAPGASYA